MSNALSLAFFVLVFAGTAAVLYLPRPHSVAAPPTHDGSSAVGVGTVRTIADVVTIEVESVSGQKFTGRLSHGADHPAHAALRPGVVLLVAFDPAAREQLSLADDMLAVRAAFDQMMLHKGLLTGEQLDLIRHGTKSRGVVTGMRTTGESREDYREVELDVIVSRPEGGQFPAHETALIPSSALDKVSPGSVIDTYYRRGDESAIAVCVSPS